MVKQSYLNLVIEILDITNNVEGAELERELADLKSPVEASV